MRCWCILLFKIPAWRITDTAMSREWHCKVEKHFLHTELLLVQLFATFARNQCFIFAFPVLVASRCQFKLWTGRILASLAVEKCPYFMGRMSRSLKWGQFYNAVWSSSHLRPSFCRELWILKILQNGRPLWHIMFHLSGSPTF
jgi:hypothetical protein